MPITRKGWELHVERLTTHKHGVLRRTYGRYQVYLDGVAQPALGGFICEAPGPGDNTATGKNKRCVEAGRYQLETQFGYYRSMGYADRTKPEGTPPMPSFRLEDRGVRDGILVHPGHIPTLYLSSIGCLNPTQQIGPREVMNFWDSRQRVIDMLDSLRAFAPAAFAHAVNTKIPDAFAVIDEAPAQPEREVPMAAVAAVAVPEFAMAMPASLPIAEGAAHACATWLVQNFGSELKAAVAGKPYGVCHLAAIVCQETAQKWVPWIGQHSVETIVERAVYDASGDYPGAPRSAFPVDTKAFRDRYGKAFTDLLVAEANKTRALQGWGEKPWVYKGYGLFQYDLQHVLTDRAFFEQKQWYDFGICLRKCTQELDRKLAVAHGDLWRAIKAYNGSGSRAEAYMANVRYFTPICAAVTGEALDPARGTLASLARPARARLATAALPEALSSKTLSGPDWVKSFPDTASLDDLDPAFGVACKAFLGALNKAGAGVHVSSTRRPRERAYLMNGAWQIAREGVDPAALKDFPGVAIEWVHRKADGTVDLAASRRAATAMVAAYGLAYKPSLNSNHIRGTAIDMTIRWTGTLDVENAKGRIVVVSDAPRSGSNQALWAVGASYGVRKLASDPPHWSADGH